MNRKFTFVALLGALILFASCTKDVNGEGSIGLDTSVVARQIFGEGLSRQISGLDTNELEKSLMEFVNQNFKINFKLTLSGDFEGSDTQPVSAWNFLWADLADSQDNDSYILRIKNIPIGSKVDVKVEADFDITSIYEESIESLINEYFSKLSLANVQDPSFMQNLRDRVLNRFSAEQYKDVKFEGSTSAPVTIHAGKNKTVIELEQTGGFKMNGGFSLDLESSDSLELLVENNYEENYISIKPADSNYEFVRVEYTPNEFENFEPFALDLDESTVEIPNQNDVGEQSQYSILLEEEEIFISKSSMYDEQDWIQVSQFFDGTRFLFIIARNKITGKYKTTVYKGL